MSQKLNVRSPVQLKTLCAFLNVMLPVGSLARKNSGELVTVAGPAKLCHNKIYLAFIHRQEKHALPVTEFNLTSLLNSWFEPNEDKSENKENQSEKKISAENYFRYYAREKPLWRAIKQTITRFQAKHNKNKPHPAHECIRNAIREQYDNPTTETNTN